MAITYDLPSNTITVTGYTEGVPASFTDIYNADVAGGWGVVTNDQNHFSFKCRLRVGDGGAGGHVGDVEKSITFTLPAVGGYWAVEVDWASTFRLGVCTDATKKTTENGCSLWTNSTVWHRVFYSHDGGTVNLYGSTIGAIGTNTAPQFYPFGGATKIYESNLQAELMFIWATNVDIYRSTIAGHASYGLQNAAGTLDDVYVHDVDTAWWVSIASVVASNAVIRRMTSGHLIETYNMANDQKFINLDTDTWNINWTGTNTGKILRQYTFDLTVSDVTGAVISGATVTLKDKNGNVVFTDTTDVNGRVPTKTVSRGYYDEAHGDTLQEYSPHTLIISKTSFITLSTIFTFDKYLDWRMVLLKQLTGNAVPSEVLAGKTFYSDNVDTKLTGTLTFSSGGGGTRIEQRFLPSPLLKPLMQLTINLLEQKKRERNQEYLILEENE